MIDPNRLGLIATAQALEELCDELVFIGGSVVGLLLSDSGSEPARATKDVDVIVEVSSRIEYEHLTRRLQLKGFEPDSDGPICRYKRAELMIDVMPLDADILGFSNPWYSHAMRRFKAIKLDNTISINVVTAPVFVATKFAAFQARGANDPFMSHDLEDVLLIVDGRSELLDEISSGNRVVRDFVIEELSTLQSQPYFQDLIAGTFQAARGLIVRERIRAISNLKTP